MMALFDMLNNAQNGGAMNEIAGKFGLDQSQMSSAMEALMPAFSTGLKRNTATPDATMQFMKALSSGNHAQYFENAAKAYSPEGVADGNNILGHLFGSKDVSRAVAAQAEAASGVGQDVIKQLLPIIATTLMGGMFNQTNDQARAFTQSGGSNPLGDLIGQMMGGGLGAQQKGASNPLGQMMEGMFGGQKTGSGGNNPLGQMMENMFGQNAGKAGSNPFENMFGGGQAHAQEPAQNQSTANPYDELFGKMFETGRVVQDEYQKNVDSIFDQFVSGMDKK